MPWRNSAYLHSSKRVADGTRIAKAVVEWARQPIVHGPSVMYVIVLGPEDVPRITDLAAARANPALAVLSAAIHAAVRGRPPRLAGGGPRR